MNIINDNMNIINDNLNDNMNIINDNMNDNMNIINDNMNDNMNIINDNMNDNMNNIMIASFIAHGFLDLITFFPRFYKHLSWYLICALFSLLTMIYYPAFGIMFFIGISMFHFGEDFRYLSGNAPNNSLVSTPHWAGALLFSTSTIVDWNKWVYTLQWLNIPYSNFLTFLVFISGIPAIFNIQSYMITFFSTLFGISGINGIIFYSSYIHTPLAIYRYIIDDNINFKGKCCCLFIWSGGTIIVFYGMNYINYLTPVIFKIGIGIVVSHIIFITKWQNNYLLY